MTYGNVCKNKYTKIRWYNVNQCILFFCLIPSPSPLLGGGEGHEITKQGGVVIRQLIKDYYNHHPQDSPKWVRAL